MSEHERPSGLLVSTRGVLPSEVLPNENGPVPEGVGTTNVLFDVAIPPPQSAGWTGWPADWNLPNWPAPDWFVNRVSTVGTCCDVIGRTVSTFQPVVVRRPLGTPVGTPPVTVDPQPLWTINPEPLMYASWDEWIRGAVNSLLMAGDLFLIATYRDATGYPTRWASLDPYHIFVQLDDQGLHYYDRDENPIPTADICHIKYQQTPGRVRGSGPIDWAARNTLSADTLAQYGVDLATRGGIPWGVLTHPAPRLSTDQVNTIRDRWNSSMTARKGAPAILSGGMTLQTLSLSPEQMALLSLREFDEQRIAAAFGVPPFFVGLPQPSGLNYTSSSMLADLFYRTTLKAMAKNITAAISQWALPYGTNLMLDASDYVEVQPAIRETFTTAEPPPKYDTTTPPPGPTAVPAPSNGQQIGAPA